MTKPVKQRPTIYSTMLLLRVETGKQPDLYQR